MTPTGSRRIEEVNPASYSAGHTLKDPRRAGEEAELVDARQQLHLAGQCPRLAGVAHLAVQQLLGVHLDQVGELQQCSLALGGRGPTPADEGVGGSAHRRIHF